MYVVFDFPLFWGDVEKYTERWGLHVQDLEDMTGICPRTLRPGFNFKHPVGLASVCKLAKVCGLDLNSYNRAVTSS